MGLISGIQNWILKDRIVKLENEIVRKYGSDFYAAMLRNVTNRPVYMPDNIEEYIQSGYLFNPIVYSVVSFIAQKASTIPWFVYEVKDEKALSLYKTASPDLQQYKKDIVRTKALVEIKDHELSSLFVSPNTL